MKLVVFPYLPKFDIPSNYLSRLPTQSLYFALGHDPASFIGNVWENCDDHVVSFPNSQDHSNFFTKTCQSFNIFTICNKTIAW